VEEEAVEADETDEAVETDSRIASIAPWHDAPDKPFLIASIMVRSSPELHISSTSMLVTRAVAPTIEVNFESRVRTASGTPSTQKVVCPASALICLGVYGTGTIGPLGPLGPLLDPLGPLNPATRVALVIPAPTPTTPRVNEIPRSNAPSTGASSSFACFFFRAVTDLCVAATAVSTISSATRAMCVAAHAIIHTGYIFLFFFLFLFLFFFFSFSFFFFFFSFSFFLFIFFFSLLRAFFSSFFDRLAVKKN
jgi:hypothetical protein